MTNYYTPGGNPMPPAPPKEPKKSVPIWAWILGGLLAVAIIVGIAVGVNSSKDDNDKPAPAPTATVTVEPTKEAKPKETIKAAPEDPNYHEPTTDIRTEEGFADYMRDTFPILEDYSDKEITDRAEKACIILDNGGTMQDVFEDSITEATSEDDATAFGGIVGGGISVLCPEYQEEMMRFAEEQQQQQL